MSKIFYDHLIILNDVDRLIKDATDVEEERHELLHLIDELIHHRVFGCILGHLPREHHEEFLDSFHQTPHDEALIEFINEKTEQKIEEVIQKEMETLKEEILETIRGKKEE